jgi:hypothetical protein
MLLYPVPSLLIFTLVLSIVFGLCCIVYPSHEFVVQAIEILQPSSPNGCERYMIIIFNGNGVHSVVDQDDYVSCEKCNSKPCEST